MFFACRSLVKKDAGPAPSLSCSGGQCAVTRCEKGDGNQKILHEQKIIANPDKSFMIAN